MASMSQTSIVREGAAVHNVLFRDLHLLGHDEQQHDADDQKQNAADQINGVLDVLLLELRAPSVQPCFDAFYQIFHLFPLLFETQKQGVGAFPSPCFSLFRYRGPVISPPRCPYTARRCS